FADDLTAEKHFATSIANKLHSCDRSGCALRLRRVHAAIAHSALCDSPRCTLRPPTVHGAIISAMHRFFAPALDPGDDTVLLPRDEAEHLTRVLRLGVGDTVAVFDGRGHEFLARVASAIRRDVRVQLLSRVDTPPEPSVALTLVQAVLKGEKMDDVVRDAVMLGVSAIQ